MPRYMTFRGTQLGGSYRYIDPKYSGTLSGQFLNYDKILGRDRWKYDWQQRQMLGRAWNGYANVSKVSDSLYPIDFSYGIGGAVTNQFRQEVGTNYGGIKNWNFTARALTFQTLQPDPTSPGSSIEMCSGLTAQIESMPRIWRLSSPRPARRLTRSTSARRVSAPRRRSPWSSSSRGPVST